jgi:ElaB/YqjD/DUF883 family membrane-anchored ribosome-binding protein
MAKKTESKMEEKKENIKNPVMEKKIEDAKKKALKELEIIKKRVASAEKKAHEYMKKNPEKSILIAAGIGAAVGAAVALALRKK